LIIYIWILKYNMIIRLSLLMYLNLFF
jgi:hypothetical protein